MTRQASKEQSRRIALVAVGIESLIAIAAAVIAWQVWDSFVAVLVAVFCVGTLGLFVGVFVMLISSARSRYPLDPPLDK